MKKFSRRKMALALACASIFGGKTQAMKEPQSRQNVVAVGRATDKNSNKRFANRAKDHKWQLAVGIGVPVAAASILAFLGVKYWGKKDNGGEPNKKPNINNPDVNNEIQQKKETIQVQNPINANPISVPVPVAKVEPKEESIIEKNIAKIKRASRNVDDNTFKLFFDKVKIILDNKDKLVTSMVIKLYQQNDIDEFGAYKFGERLLTEKGYYDPKKYIGAAHNKYVQNVIKFIVDGIIESLYNKEIVALSGLDNVLSDFVLSFGDSDLIIISGDGKTLYLGHSNYRIKFNIESLNIGDWYYREVLKS